MEGNRTIEREDDPIAGPGRLLFVDTGDWAIVTRPALGHSWGWRGERVGLQRSATVDGPGVAGAVITYLGPYDEHTRTVAGERLRLIEPAAAELAEPPDAILDSVGDAADRLRVGARSDEVLMIAAPTANIRWGVRGLQTGAADLWTRDSERLADADNVWLHEYVHTRQEYTLERDLKWFTEAAAVYYAALFTYEQGRIDFEAFADRLARGGEEQFASARLDSPQTWRVTHANYFTGALVTGELDRQLRVATDGQQTLQAVFSRVNAHPEPVSAAQFGSFLETTGGPAVRQAGSRFTTTTDRPQMWDSVAHQEIFDRDPPRFGYELEAVTVDGVAGSPPTVTATPGATVEVTVRITNHGGTTGTYVATVFHDEEAVDTLQGSLDSGESTTRTVTRELPTPGVFQLGLGDAGVTIDVADPAADAVVTDDAQPGFGVAAAVLALVSAAVLARRR